MWWRTVGRAIAVSEGGGSEVAGSGQVPSRLTSCRPGGKLQFPCGVDLNLPWRDWMLGRRRSGDERGGLWSPQRSAEKG